MRATVTIQCDRLSYKIKGMGLADKTCAWIAEFLRDRTYRVRVNKALSELHPASSGVPQGTVLGPLLFKIFINDLKEGIMSNMTLFADDVLLYRVSKGPLDEICLKTDLAKLQHWSRSWNLPFNVAKCVYMRFSPRSILFKEAPVRYLMYGEQIPFAHQTKYLGLTLQSDLKWSHHLENTVKKASGVLGFLRRNYSLASKRAKLQLYNALVRPILDYCSEFYDPTTIKDAKRIESIQRRAARYICNDYGMRSSVTAMMNELGVVSLQKRRYTLRTNFVLNVISGKFAVPDVEIKRCIDGKVRVYPQLPHSKYRDFLFYRTAFELNSIHSNDHPRQSIPRCSL